MIKTAAVFSEGGVKFRQFSSVSPSQAWYISDLLNPFVQPPKGLISINI